MSTRLGECLQGMSASSEGGDVTICSQSESVFERIEGCFNRSRDSFPNICDNRSTTGDIHSSCYPDMDESEENYVEYRAVESDEDSDCMILNDVIPTTVIIEDSEELEEEDEGDRKSNNKGKEELANTIKSLSNCSPLVIDLSKESDSEFVENEENDTKNLVTSEDENNNESLPDGWNILSNGSGLPTYYHAESRVCTMTRPYFIGPLGVRGHKIPIEAIPCLWEKQKKKMAVSASSQHFVSAKKIHLYCKRNLFKFKSLKLLYHQSWKKERWYNNMVKRYQNKKLLSHKVQLPVRGEHGKDIMVPFNIYKKNSVMLLSEYVNFAFRKPVIYEVKILQYHGQSFLAKVFIDGNWYGSRIGSTQKLAKCDAAQFVLSVILGGSQMKKLKLADERVCAREPDDLDSVDVDDPRVTLLCKTKNEVLPFAMLEKALKKNKNLMELEVHCKIANEPEGSVYLMEVGKYEARVKCQNKIDGKHEAAQKILKQMHPIVRSWGGLVRLYRESFDFEEDEKEIVYVKREVEQGLLEELKRQFAKFNEERREKVYKSHNDLLWEPKLLRYNPSFGSNSV